MKDTVLRELGEQLKSWRRHLRVEFQKVDNILALIDNPPEGKGIPTEQWNIFIRREAGPKKLEQRNQNKANKRKRTDAHVLGRLNYGEFEQMLVRLCIIYDYA